MSPIHRQPDELSSDSSLNLLVTPCNEPANYPAALAQEYYIETLQCQHHHGTDFHQEQKKVDSPEVFDLEGGLLISKLKSDALLQNVESAKYQLEWHTPVKEGGPCKTKKKIKSLLKVTAQCGTNNRVQKKLKEYKDKVYFDLNRVQGSFLKDSPAKMLCELGTKQGGCSGNAEKSSKIKLYKDVHKQINSLGRPTRNRKIETPDSAAAAPTTACTTRRGSSFLKPDMLVAKPMKCCRNATVEMGRCRSEMGSNKKVIPSNVSPGLAFN